MFGDGGSWWRYQCVELVQRWTTRVQRWRDKDGKPLPGHWAGPYAKAMLDAAEKHGLPTVRNDRSAEAPPEAGDLTPLFGGLSLDHYPWAGKADQTGFPPGLARMGPGYDSGPRPSEEK